MDFHVPLEIPAVFEFDYGDNSALPTARVLNYYQDLNEDHVPDYTAVWLGATTTYDTEDPSNADATGDQDDGFSITEVITSEQVTANFDLSASGSMTVYYGLGIDWDDDGTFDETHFGSQAITDF